MLSEVVPVDKCKFCTVVFNGYDEVSQSNSPGDVDFTVQSYSTFSLSPWLVSVKIDKGTIVPVVNLFEGSKVPLSFKVVLSTEASASFKETVLDIVFVFC